MSLESALLSFSNQPLLKAARSLFKDTLDIPLSPLADAAITPQRFFRDAYKEEKHAVIKEIYLTGKITDESFMDTPNAAPDLEALTAEMKEISDYQGLFVFAVDLGNYELNRGQLATLTRDINRLIPSPVIVVFKHGEGNRLVLSFGVASRRENLKESGKHVLGKVSMIRDVDIHAPHRGHLDLLEMFSIRKLTKDGGKPVTSFKTFHSAIEKIFNVELLNKKFYRELSNWYFWAMRHCHFPLLDETADRYFLFKDKEKVREHEAKNLIRLLTRILFVWFIKQKSLVPDAFFDPDFLAADFLEDFDPDSKDTRYYKAILQNLFFASLNQTHGKREFRKSGQHQNTTTLLRYESELKKPQAFIDAVEQITPFLNGGLFDCLDYPHATKKGSQGGAVIIYEDGFSDRKDNPLVMPDFLFFGARQDGVDLSPEYGDPKKKSESVRGLIHILNDYKFTIVENTPIEQEIALDPELLGQVFENLLASYNEETKTTARKQTGSFYTPRPIVDYMVDESLKSHLVQALVKDSGIDREEAESKLEILFTYNDETNPFDESQTQILISSIDNCKILDPACGSGAFPMGALQKLVYVLGKLDPKDELWEQRQLAKVDALIEAAQEFEDSTFRERAIEDAEAQRKDIKEAFAKNELGYGRKLYLIENCLYGVDIQSIATQVSKLRFFISLIVEQKVDKKRDNFGIRPLPNLETKFVTADTLIKIEKPKAQGELFELAEVSELQKQLKRVRHDLFSAKTPPTKRKYRKRDEELRAAIAEELKQNGWSNDAADKLAAWDPYDQNASASYFDPEWMFGLVGFDIVIGNPPYVSVEKFAENPIQQKWKSNFETYAPRGDIYCLFYERGAELLRKGGSLVYITSNKWMRASYGKGLRGFLSTQVDTESVLDFGMAQNFGAATTYTCITRFYNQNPDERILACYVKDDRAAMADPAKYFDHNAVLQSNFSDGAWVLLTKERLKIKSDVEAKGIPLTSWEIEINSGIKTSHNKAFIVNQARYNELVSEDPSSASILHPILRGEDVKRYCNDWKGFYVIGTFKQLRGTYELENYPAIEKHLLKYREELEPRPSGWDQKKDGKWKGRNTQPFDYLWYEVFFCPDIKLFCQPKLMYPNMTKFLPFYLDKEEDFFCNQKAFIITSDIATLSYLTSFFNSSIFRCCFKDDFPELLGNTYELSKKYFKYVPVLKPSRQVALRFINLVQLIQFAKVQRLDATYQFLEALIDACVMDCYFPEHMAERDLLVQDAVAAQLKDFDPEADAANKATYLEALHIRLKATDLPLKLQAIPEKSPDLLGVILKEGKV